MGVCSDICVPAMASFSLPLDFIQAPIAGRGSVSPRPCRAHTPLALDRPSGRHWDSPHLGRYASNALVRSISTDPRVEPLSLIADASASGHLFGAPQKSPDSSAILLPLLGGAPTTAAPEGKPVTLTFMTEMGPFSSVDDSWHTGRRPGKHLSLWCGAQSRALTKRVTKGRHDRYDPGWRTTSPPSRSNWSIRQRHRRYHFGCRARHQGTVVFFACSRRVYPHLRHLASARLRCQCAEAGESWALPASSAAP